MPGVLEGFPQNPSCSSFPFVRFVPFVLKDSIMTWLRHLLSIAILPFTMTVLVPLWIARPLGRGTGSSARGP